jgi:hypothetical protein
MPETLGYLPQFQDFHPAMVSSALASEVWATPKVEASQPKSPLEKQIDYFDRSWQREGLPQDWFEINDVGFSIKKQMALLKGDDKKWVEQTSRDLLGFSLEYLQQGTVFPFEYEIEGGQLVDAKYGRRRMVDTVDPREREGAVLESLRRMQQHLLEGKDGAIAIMVSPPGPTGLTMDDGRSIFYNDTMVFHMQKQGDRVIGITLRSDSTNAKAVVEELAGQALPQVVTVMDCVRALSLNQGDATIGANDLVGILEKVSGGKNAYKEKTWGDMRRDLARRQFLYDFDSQVQAIVEDLNLYVLAGTHSKLEIQKALAATFLRLSKYMLFDQRDEREDSFRLRSGDIFITPTYGQIVDEVKKLPGCAGGGGSATSILSVIDRSVTIGLGISDEDIEAEIKYKFDEPGPCVKCDAEGEKICGPCGLCKKCDIDMRRKEKMNKLMMAA